MNAYFQLLGKEGKTMLRLVPATDGGNDLSVSDAIDYLNFNKILYDLPSLNAAIIGLTEETVVQLNNDPLVPVNEQLTITIAPDKMTAMGVFVCRSDKGQEITKDEILSDLKYKGIKFGVDDAGIDAYLADKKYLEPIVLAKGEEPVQGKDASIEYFFNTDVHARPTLNEDGTVDFFNLNIINHVQEGELLARLTREVKGKPGTDVLGARIPPRNVTRKVLKFGRNIRLSEDKTEIYAMCNGHVTFVDGRVFVSDVMQVENVDPTTGNIDYEGNVQVNGNVCSNFEVHAKGNVEIKGVVEGAVVEAGGNITIARGMNGMGKGRLKSGGNVVAKFIENSTVEAAGYVESGSIMHSDVVAGTEINVEGRKAFISGGKVTATSKVETKILGSDMGTDTIVEIGVSALVKKQHKEIEDSIAELDKVIDRAMPIMEAARDKVEAGIALNEEQLDNVRNIFNLTRIKAAEREGLVAEKERLEEILAVDKDAKVVVKDTVYPGTKIVISDVSKIIKESVQHCKFMKTKGDVKMLGL
ncbi:MAG: FapA family protein [Lachnospiraceae bacterium]|nr:FapA family protein [Lachnospiraceae bacterium]